MPKKKPAVQFDLDCGARLAAARTVLGLTQDVFADEINLTRSAVSNYEGGGRSIDPAVADRIFRRFRIDASWLFHGDPSRLPSDMASDIVRQFSAAPPRRAADVDATSQIKANAKRSNRRTRKTA